MRTSSLFSRGASAPPEGLASVEEDASTASVVVISERDFDWACLRVSDFGLSMASVGLARLPGQVGVSEYGYGPTDLAEPVVRLAALVLTREPAFALLHWTAEAVLKPILRSRHSGAQRQVR
jgi:hypothetical protein